MTPKTNYASKRILAVVVMACTSLAPLSSVTAQSLRETFRRAPPEPRSEGQIRDWTGFYLGTDASLTGAALYFDSPLGHATTYGTESYTAGIFGGYNWRTKGQWVVGLEGGFAMSDFAHSPLEGYEDLLGLPSRADLSLRVGELTTPRTYVYSRAGLGFETMETRSGFDQTNSSSELVGILGLGVESQITDRFNGRVELRHTMTAEHMLDDAGASYGTQDLGLHVGLSYHFGDYGLSPTAFTPRATPDWTGPYLGALLGQNLGSIENLVEGRSHGKTAVVAPLYGISGGYDHVFKDKWLVGAEAEYLGFSQDYIDNGGNAISEEQVTRFASITSSMAFSVRFGYLVQPETLVYAKVGQTTVSFEANPEFYPLGGGGDEGMSGLHWGFGVETPIWKKATLRIEGMHFDADAPFVTDNNQDGQIELIPSSFTGRIAALWRW